MIDRDITDSDNSAGDVSIKIKTDATSENGKDIIVGHKTAGGNIIGDIVITFGESGVYILIGYCQIQREELPDHLPVESEKVWNIVRTTEPRIVVYVNGVEVVNFLLSDETCPYDDDGETWRDYWKGDVEAVSLNTYTSGLIAGYMFGKYCNFKIRIIYLVFDQNP